MRVDTSYHEEFNETIDVFGHFLKSYFLLLKTFVKQILLS